MLSICILVHAPSIAVFYYTSKSGSQSNSQTVDLYPPTTLSKIDLIYFFVLSCVFGDGPIPTVHASL